MPHVILSEAKNLALNAIGYLRDSPFTSFSTAFGSQNDGLGDSSGYVKNPFPGTSRQATCPARPATLFPDGSAPGATLRSRGRSNRRKRAPWAGRTGRRPD